MLSLIKEKEDKIASPYTKEEKDLISKIASKYGGGGHPLACGATIESLPTIDLVLKDFCKLLEE